MSLHFGVATVEVTGKPIARVNNVTVNITYDTALLRGDSRIFPDHCALYNGNIEGTFENGEVQLSSIADMLGATYASSGMTVSGVSGVLITGLDLVVSSITNGITGTLTFYNCFFPGMTFNIDRENYLMPSTNFVVAGETTGSGGKVMNWTVGT